MDPGNQEEGDRVARPANLCRLCPMNGGRPMSTIEPDTLQSSQPSPVYGEQPPQKSSNRGCWIGCGVVALIGLLICCGGIAYFGVKGPAFLANAVNEAMADQVRGQLAVEPNVQAQIGEIQSLEFDFTKTIENAQKASESGQEPKMAFRIQGTKGSGVVLIENDPSGPGGAGIKSGTLVMDDGTEYPLDMESIGPPSSTDMQINFDDMIDEGESASEDQPQAIEVAPIEVEPIDLEGAIPGGEADNR